MISVYHSFFNIVKTLLEAKADVTHKDSFGKDAIARCKDPKILSMLTQATQEPPKREISPMRTKPVPRTPVKSASRESTPAKKNTPQLLKFQDELNRHIGASANTLTCKAAEDCLARLTKTMNSEMIKAYELLHNQVHSLLESNIKEVYQNLGSRIVETLDEMCSEKGLHIPPVPYKLPELQVSFQQKRGPPKLSGQTHKRVYDRLMKIGAPSLTRNSFSSQDLSSQLCSQIESHVSSLAQQLDKISSEQIETDVKTKVDQLSQFILQEVESNMGYLSSKLFNELQALIEERFQNIVEYNQTGNVSRVQEPNVRVISTPAPRMPRNYTDSSLRKSVNYSSTN